MSGIPAAQGPGSESPEPKNSGAQNPPPRPPGEDPPSPAEHERTRWKKIFAPLVLAILGGLLLLAARLEYPRVTTDVPNASLSSLIISTTVKLSEIDYTVFQRSPTATDVSISLIPLGGEPERGPALAELYLSQPSAGIPGSGVPILHKQVFFQSIDGGVSSTVANFYLKARSFGVTYNGVTASAAIPRILLQGQGTPILDVSYFIPSASSYDWSSFPATVLSNSIAAWTVYFAKTNSLGPSWADTQGQIAVGINRSAQAHDDTGTFIAGALLGLGGAAIIAGVQEALHTGD